VHRYRLADALVDEGGIQLLLSLPRTQHIHTSLSLVLVGITLIPSAFQKTAALPPPLVGSFVEASLSHLRCSLDPARKNASVFFGNALMQPRVLEVFDSLEGLRQMLAALSASMLLLKSGSGQELKQEKQVLSTLSPFSYLFLVTICCFAAAKLRIGPRAEAEEAGLSPIFGPLLVQECCVVMQGLARFSWSKSLTKPSSTVCRSATTCARL